MILLIASGTVMFPLRCVLPFHLHQPRLVLTSGHNLSLYLPMSTEFMWPAGRRATQVPRRRKRNRRKRTKTSPVEKMQHRIRWTKWVCLYGFVCLTQDCLHLDHLCVLVFQLIAVSAWNVILVHDFLSIVFLYKGCPKFVSHLCTVKIF